MTNKPGSFRDPINTDLSHLHPTVQFLLEEAQFQRVPMTTIHRQARLGINAIYDWKRGTHPSVIRLDAALNVIGYTLAVVPKNE